MRAVTERLKILREKNKDTQEDVAKKLGITQQVYSNYESDKCDLPLRHLVHLADMYDVSTDYILGRTSYPRPPHQLSQYFIQNVSVGDLVYRITSYEQNSRRLLVQYLNFLTYMENSKKKPDTLTDGNMKQLDH